MELDDLAERKGGRERYIVACMLGTGMWWVDACFVSDVFLFFSFCLLFCSWLGYLVTAGKEGQGAGFSTVVSERLIVNGWD